MSEDLRAVGAARLHAAHYTRDGEKLVCRACGRRIEPSMAIWHLRTPSHMEGSAREQVARLGLVPIQTWLLRDLDDAGLVVWITTGITPEGEEIHEAYTQPRVLAFARRIRPDTRVRRIAPLGALTRKQLYARIDGGRGSSG